MAKKVAPQHPRVKTRRSRSNQLWKKGEPDKSLTGKPPGNRFRPNAKFDETTFVRLAYCFCNGVPVAIAARTVKLSQKTARGVYLDLRKRLVEPAFNRWHGTNRRFANLPGPEYKVMLRAAYFDRLAQCALNETCARNWRLGNRKQRQCRKCPLAEFFSDERRAEAYTVIDTVHRFYEILGIRRETGIPPASLFQERLIHTTVVATVYNSRPKGRSELFDIREVKFLSGGSLMRMIIFPD